jgi:PBP1b-binding outer membrane lipoprotein LpoB
MRFRGRPRTDGGGARLTRRGTIPRLGFRIIEPMRTLLSTCGLLAVLLSTGCGTPEDRRVDPDSPDEVGGAALQSQDIRTIADRMARDLGSTGILTSTAAGQTVTFHITEMKNESSDVINKSIILTKLRTDLFKELGGRVVVLDRSAEGLEAVMREREAKRSGAVAGNEGKRAAVLGSDYVLKGVIQDRVQQAGDAKSAYYLVTMELTDLETGRLVWTNDYEAKFLSEKSVITR